MIRNTKEPITKHVIPSVYGGFQLRRKTKPIIYQLDYSANLKR